MKNGRVDVLRALIELSGSVDSIAKELVRHPWDSDGDAQMLLRSNVINVLYRYLNEELSDKDIERWANLIEGREDITFEPRYENIIGEIVYELANPYLTVPLTLQRGREIVGLLREQM